MKKILALLIALVMSFSLFACGDKEKSDNLPSSENKDNVVNSADGEEPDNSGDTADDTEKALYPNANDDGTLNLDSVANFDPDYDYKQNPELTIAYIANSASALYQYSADAYELWCPRFNCKWVGFTSSEGDNDMYMTTLQTYLDQGVQGFILDPDSTIFTTVVELMDDYPEAQWMSQMAPARDGVTGDNVPVGGNLMHPYVGFDNYEAGVIMTEGLIQWKKDNLPDVAWEDIGFLTMGYSISPVLQERVNAARDVWVKETGSDVNYFVADCTSSGINIQGGIDAAGPIVTVNSEYDYWLVMGLLDDLAQGAAVVLDQAGLTDNSCVTTFGGTNFVVQWDAGQFDACRIAVTTGHELYAEPLLGAIYAYLNGWATPDTIWPSWIKSSDYGADGHTYASRLLPTIWLAEDDYQKFYKWLNLYVGEEIYDYDVEVTIDDYTSFVEVPDSYK